MKRVFSDSQSITDNAMVQRKRQRPVEWRRQGRTCSNFPDLRSVLSIASLAIASTQMCMTSNAYVLTPTRIRRSHYAYRPMRLETTVTSTDDTTEEYVVSESRLKEQPEQLPPWLACLDDKVEDPTHVSRQVEWFEYALLEQNFSPQDIELIMNTMEKAAAGDVAKLVGSMEFCHLLLQLEEPSLSLGQHVFVTKEVLLASVLHYSECVTARQVGVYELVKKACKQRVVPVEDRRLPECQEEEQLQLESTEMQDPEIVPSDTAVCSSYSDSSLQRKPGESKMGEEVVFKFGRAGHGLQTSELGEEVMKIAAGAARIKQVEIVAHAVLGEGRTPSMEEASRLRGLLLSVMDDWRALAIRCAASLYRLEGIFSANHGTAEYLERTPQVVQTARDALRIYAPLAQRLGMQRLKAQLEALSFRILYRRQYQAVSSLYSQVGATWDAKEAMQSVSAYLTKHITQVLRQDKKLMTELADLQVTARVKEPYSLWKKLLKSRKKPQKKALLGSPGSSSLLPSQSELSVLEVLDAVALRIILKARKWTADEPDDVTRDRERLLCYYVQQVIRDYWPATNEKRIKDYIQAPKPNGYQSLHYTSSVSCFGEDWPFEVQVRSEEMHRIAEYGVAAHWDYKLKGGKTVAQIRPSHDGNGYTLSLPPAKRVSGSMIPGEVASGGISDKKEMPTSDESSSDSYIDALITAREDLVQQNVFVFFTKSSMMGDEGQLVSLPVGAKVRDALVLLESQLGKKLSFDTNDDINIFRNGRLAEMDDFVGTGDLLLVDM